MKRKNKSSIFEEEEDDYYRLLTFTVTLEQPLSIHKSQQRLSPVIRRGEIELGIWTYQLLWKQEGLDWDSHATGVPGYVECKVLLTRSDPIPEESEILQKASDFITAEIAKLADVRRLLLQEKERRT